MPMSSLSVFYGAVKLNQWVGKSMGIEMMKGLKGVLPNDNWNQMSVKKSCR